MGKQPSAVAIVLKGVTRLNLSTLVDLEGKVSPKGSRASGGGSGGLSVESSGVCCLLNFKIENLHFLLVTKWYNEGTRLAERLLRFVLESPGIHLRHLRLVPASELVLCEVFSLKRPSAVTCISTIHHSCS